MTTRKEEIRKILDEEHINEYKATLGENRGQLFLRIPKKVAEALQLKKGNKAKFKLNDTKKEVEIKIGQND